MIRVIEATMADELHLASQILREFLPHQRMRYAADIEIVDRYFDDDAYEAEVSDLHSVYTPPHGCVLLALEGEAPVGAVCLKRMDLHYCEMKRLFVPIQHRRKGIGGSLSEALLVAARARGYTHMRLDTGTFMVESHHLYRKMGFREVEPYYEVHGPLRDGLIFMELEL